MTAQPSAPLRAARWPLLIWLALSLLAAWQVVRNTYTADLGAFLPRSADPQQAVLMEQLRSGAAARLLLIGIEGGGPALRAQVSRELAKDLRASGLFEQVSNGEENAWRDLGEWMFRHRYLLSPAVSPEHFTAQGIRSSLEDALSRVGTPGMSWLRDVLPQDPTGESLRLLEELLPVNPPRTEQGVWMSRAHPRAVLMASLAAAPQDLDAQEAALLAVRQRYTAIVSSSADPGARELSLLLSGAPVFAVESRSRIRGEVEWLTTAGSIVAGLLLLLAFGSLPAIGVAALPVITGILFGVAVVGLLFGSVHGITLAFGTTLIGEAIDYGIYYLIQVRRHAQEGSTQAWRQWLSDGWPAIRLGVLTSVCGFAALVFSGFPGLQQLGVFSLVGLLAAAATTRGVLPVLMPAGSGSPGWRAPLARFGRSLIQSLPRARGVFAAALAAAVCALLLRPGLWDSDLSSLSPVPSEALALDESLREDLGASDAAMVVVVRASNTQAALERTELVTQRLQRLVDDGSLGGFDAITRFVPSHETQRLRQAALPAVADLRQAVKEATDGGPLSAQRLSRFFEDIERTRNSPVLSPDEAAKGPMAPVVRALLIELPDGSVAAQVPLRLLPDGRAPDPAVVEQALTGLDQVRILAIGSELRELYRRYLGEAMTQSALGAAAVVVLLALSLRSLHRLKAVALPLLGAVVMVLGLMAAGGQKLGILHLVGLLLVVAIGSNYALFFCLSGEADSLDDDKLSSLLLANLTTVLSFGLLAASSLPALSALGLMVAPGTLLALMLSAVFSPPARGTALSS